LAAHANKARAASLSAFVPARSTARMIGFNGASVGGDLFHALPYEQHGVSSAMEGQAVMAGPSD
jgi:hypothetical protein